jgi:hypothetical protein
MEEQKCWVINISNTNFAFRVPSDSFKDYVALRTWCEGQMPEINKDEVQIFYKVDPDCSSAFCVTEQLTFDGMCVSLGKSNQGEIFGKSHTSLSPFIGGCVIGFVLDTFGDF